MITNIALGVYIKANGHQDSHGSWITESTYLYDIDVDLQPYSTQLLIKQYGYDIEVTNRIFYEGNDSNIIIGTLLKEKISDMITQTYEVKQIIPWDTYMEIMLYKLG